MMRRSIFVVTLLVGWARWAKGGLFAASLLADVPSSPPPAQTRRPAQACGDPELTSWLRLYGADQDAIERVSPCFRLLEPPSRSACSYISARVCRPAIVFSCSWFKSSWNVKGHAQLLYVEFEVCPVLQLLISDCLFRYWMRSIRWTTSSMKWRGTTWRV